MNIEKRIVNDYDVHKLNFSNLRDFYRYITDMPYNKVFVKRMDKEKDYIPHSLRTDNSYWYGTSSYEEAVELLKNGIPDVANKLTNMIKVEKKMQPVQMMKKINSIQGFQTNVPLYLMGVPNNMIGMKMQPVKQKVVNLYTNISYSASVSSETIQNECLKKFRIISKLESQNYRINLNAIFASSKNNMILSSCVKLKAANERLNISKLVFPITHTSMLRRLMIRVVEVYPDIDKNFIYGYGRPVTGSILDMIYNDGHVLPQFINCNIDKINSLDDLKNL